MNQINQLPFPLEVKPLMGSQDVVFNFESGKRRSGMEFLASDLIKEIHAGIIKTLILSTIFLFISSRSFSQAKTESLNYEIVVLGMKIGTMMAQKITEKDSLQYKVDSQVKFWFFGNVELKFNTLTHFSGGNLIKARSSSKTNRGDFSSKIDWKGYYYAVDASSYEYENKKPLKGPLVWSSTKLFFHEPSDREIFLSEVYGVTGPIKKIGPGAYEITVDGNPNRYFYTNGKLEKIILENPIKNYQVRLVK